MENSISKSELVRQYSNRLRNGYATVFIGAGVSIASGLPSWASLMEIPARAINVPISKETDLYTLAEQYVQHEGNRTALIDIIIKSMAKPCEPNISHQIISRLPYKELWTSNYDQLIEMALASCGKGVNVIRRDEDFPFSRAEKMKLFKVHGSIDLPENVVITRKDIEAYHWKFATMQQAFYSAMANKTFLFIGFGLTDHNFRTILGRLNINHGENSRQHYALLTKEANPQDQRLNTLLMQDLSKYGIKVCQMEDHSELPIILSN